MDMCESERVDEALMGMDGGLPRIPSILFLSFFYHLRGWIVYPVGGQACSQAIYNGAKC
jgi:hypothetical protein